MSDQKNPEADGPVIPPPPEKQPDPALTTYLERAADRGAEKPKKTRDR